jgi:hypothetical protein
VVPWTAIVPHSLSESKVTSQPFDGHHVDALGKIAEANRISFCKLRCICEAGKGMSVYWTLTTISVL